MNHFTTSKRGVSVLEYATSRNFLNALPIFCILFYKNEGFLKGFKPEHTKVFFARAIIGVFGIFSMTWMYSLLPMGIGATITATNPIILSFLAHHFLNEPSSGREITVIVVTFLGICLLSLAQEYSLAVKNTTYYRLGIALGLVTAVCLATNNILTRKLKAVDTDCLQFCHMIIGLVILSTSLLFTHEGALYSFPDRSTYIYLVIGGFANCVSMNIGTYTIQHSKSTNIALLRFVGVTYSFLVDLVIFREHFNWLQILAVVIILGTNVTATITKLKGESKLKHSQSAVIEVSEVKKLPES
jgi:drug/metabolite transporter (DMT)-like permease